MRTELKKIINELKPLIIALLFLAGAIIALLASPPIPGKLSSPRVAGSADTLNKVMIVTSNIVTSVTNQGAVSAVFEATKIQGLNAGFVYATNPNGPWKVLGTVPYPTNGGPVQMNYVGTNVPRLYFRAFLKFPDPVP